MKIQPSKSVILLFGMLCAGYMALAQTENTGERLITQLKNGTAPGLQFSPAAPTPRAAAEKSTTSKSESLITQIRKGTAPGMKFKAGSGTTQPAATGARKAAATSSRPLPSEQPVKKDQPKPAPVAPAAAQQQ